MPQQLLGIIGYPLRHSISPSFQQAALDRFSLTIQYQVWETEPGRLAERMRWMRRTEGMLGANVTVPHKEAVLPLMDELSDEARHLGAVNTIVVRSERLWGHNTDGLGFLRALREDGGFDVRGKGALVLGAGGAARAVALTLAREDVAWIVIANRTVERARALVEAVEAMGGRAEAVSLDPEVLKRAAQGREWDLIVNCTTLGMRHGAAEGRSPLSANLIPLGALVYDLVYNPPETPLLREAKKAGACTLGGLPMLVYQGAESFRLWTGREPPLPVMFQAAREALGVGERGFA